MPLYTDLWNYISREEYSEGASDKDKKAIRRLTSQFFIYEGILLKRSYDGYNLICLYGKDTKRRME